MPFKYLRTYQVNRFYSRTENTTKPTLSTLNLSVTGASSDTRTRDSGWAAFTSVNLEPGDLVTPKAEDEDNNGAYYFTRLGLGTEGEGYVGVTCSFEFQTYFRNTADSSEILAWSSTVAVNSTQYITRDSLVHPYASGSPGLETSVTLDLRAAGGVYVVDQPLAINGLKTKIIQTVTWAAPVRFDHKYEDMGGSIGKCITFNHAADTYEPTIGQTYTTLDNFYIHSFNARED